MKIIIEGYDGSGKSTLAKKLSEEFCIPIKHAGPPPISDEVAYDNCISQLCADNCILDRVTPISRVCYEGDRISIYHKCRLQNFKRALCLQSIVIFCVNVSDNHVLKDHDNDEHIEYLLKHKYDIISRYMYVVRATRDCITYDMFSDNVSDIIQQVKRRNNEITTGNSRTSFD